MSPFTANEARFRSEVGRNGWYQHQDSQVWQYQAAYSGYNGAMPPHPVHSLSALSPQISMTI